MAKIIARLKPYKWVVRWMVFLLVLAQLFIAASYILRPITDEREIYVGFYEIEYDLDVVCIGASSTYSYWAPLSAWAEYGIASYNLASSGTPMEAILTQLKETLAYQTPELIIIDLRRFYNRNGPQLETYIRFTTDSMRYSLKRTQLLLKLVPDRLVEDEEDTLSYYLFDIAKYHDNWKSLSYSQLSLYTNASYNLSKGFHCAESADATLEDFVDYSDITTTTAPDEYSLNVFVELLDYASDVDSEILFVVSPYDETEEAREVYNYYEALIVESGMEYLNANDYREEMDVLNVSENFSDTQHMNIFGAEKYTSFLGEYITTNYNLPDRRTDETYATIWDAEYELWTQDVLDAKAYITEELNSQIAATE